MTDNEFNTTAHFFAQRVKDMTPKRTMNLAFHATKIQSQGADKFRIYVNTVGDHAVNSQDGIAPYFQFVNDYETLRNKPNKNYHYFQRAVNKSVQDLTVMLGAYLEEGAKI